MKIELATTPYIADEFTGAAATFDAILPNLDGRDDASLLRRYGPGVSHSRPTGRAHSWTASTRRRRL
jgi:hypothetical protein